MTEMPVAEPAFNEWRWESREQAQRRRYANLALVDKISWLEEA